MRILHCLRAPVGGLFRHVLDLAGEQAVRGHDVGIVADSLSEDRLTPSKFAAVAPALTLGIHRLAMPRQPGLGDWRAAQAVRKLVSPLAVDVLHGHGAKGGAYARLAARGLNRDTSRERLAVIYTPHGGTLHYAPSSLEGRIYFTLERLLARSTSAIIFESAYSARLFAERVTTAVKTVRVIPNGLKPADFDVIEPRADAADVLFVGELRHLKGVDLLLDALAQLNAERRTTAAIVGGGPDDAAFRAQCDRLDLGGVVTFHGPMPARDAFALGRVMVVPSRAESFPYIVLEAAAAGLPLVATDVGGIPEIVAGTDTALIAAGSAAAIADAVNHALADPDASAAKSRRLRTKIAESFNVSRMTDDVLAVYDAARR